MYFVLVQLTNCYPKGEGTCKKVTKFMAKPKISHVF